MALLVHRYVTLDQVMQPLPTMPVDDREQRRLRASIRRRAKSLREAGHDVPDA